VGVAEPPHRQPGSTAELIGDQVPSEGRTVRGSPAYAE
jgi:hypothetical protein